MRERYKIMDMHYDHRLGKATVVLWDSEANERVTVECDEPGMIGLLWSRVESREE